MYFRGFIPIIFGDYMEGVSGINESKRYQNDISSNDDMRQSRDYPTKLSVFYLKEKNNS